MSALPYSSATSGEKALGEMQKLLRAFGCQKFGSMVDDVEGTLLVQFEYRGRDVVVKASTKGYAAAWLKSTPYTRRMQAMNVAGVAAYSILRDWIKGQITAIETGVLSFEGAFLGQILLANGRTVIEHAEASQLLPPLVAIEGSK